MNLTLNNLNLAANAKPAPAAAAAAAAPVAASATVAPAANDAAGAAALAQDLAGLDSAGAQPAAQPALAFAQWLGLGQGQGACAVAADSSAATPAAADAATKVVESPADEERSTADNVLLGAMSMAMPLMPVAQATLAAVAAALPGVPAAKEPAPATDTDVSPQAGDGRASPAAPMAMRVQASALPLAGAGADAAVTVSDAAAVAVPLQAAPDATVAKASPNGNAGAFGSVSAKEAAPSGDALAAGEGAQDQGAAPLTERAPGTGFSVAAPASGAAQRSADTVTLSGPPTAWRQTLQEALGDRLQLQVGRNAEQAVIRLEPPMLGRVEIAIRHSAGALEVHISATHGEVLRQLQSVSDNLRNDLAQRQFTDVSVNIAPAPRAANATPQFAGDANGRGRQQDGREQEKTPGNALAEAHTGASPFSLNGRA